MRRTRLCYGALEIVSVIIIIIIIIIALLLTTTLEVNDPVSRYVIE